MSTTTHKLPAWFEKVPAARARIDTCERFGLEPDPADVELVRQADQEAGRS